MKKENMKIGIVVVYYLPPNMDWLLELHLNEIARTTKDADYMIYGAAQRLANSYLNTLKHNSFVTLPELQKTNLTGSQEHCFYLDQLINCAINDNCTHILTLDVDSWPIEPNWCSKLTINMEQNNYVLSAVLRGELGDEYLAHPCGTFFSKDFYKKYEFSMWGEEVPNDARKRFKQRQDSGYGLAYLLWNENIQWLKLLRSNKTDFHYLMGAIYGELFFHLGATGRLKIFNKELSQTWQRSIANCMATLPILWKRKRKIEDFLLHQFPPQIHKKNQKIFMDIIRSLKNNPNELYEKLKGNSKIL